MASEYIDTELDNIQYISHPRQREEAAAAAAPVPRPRQRPRQREEAAAAAAPVPRPHQTAAPQQPMQQSVEEKMTNITQIDNYIIFFFYVNIDKLTSEQKENIFSIYSEIKELSKRLKSGEDRYVMNVDEFRNWLRQQSEFNNITIGSYKDLQQSYNKILSKQRKLKKQSYIEEIQNYVELIIELHKVNPDDKSKIIGIMSSAIEADDVMTVKEFELALKEIYNYNTLKSYEDLQHMKAANELNKLNISKIKHYVELIIELHNVKSKDVAIINSIMDNAITVDEVMTVDDFKSFLKSAGDYDKLKSYDELKSMIKR